MSEGSMRPVRIFMAEDDKELAKQRAAYFERRGCEVVTVHTAPDAARLLASEEVFDVVLTDINLGTGPDDMSGLGLARASREARPSTPIVAYTAFFAESELPLEEHPEIDRLFVKGNLGLEELEESMRSVMELGRQARASRES